MKFTATPTPSQGSRGAAGKETPDEKGRGKYRPEAAKAGDPAAPEMAGKGAALSNRKKINQLFSNRCREKVILTKPKDSRPIGATASVYTGNNRQATVSLGTTCPRRGRAEAPQRWRFRTTHGEKTHGTTGEAYLRRRFSRPPSKSRHDASSTDMCDANRGVARARFT